MKDVVDNKKKWRVVAIVAFCFIWPYIVQNFVYSHCALVTGLGAFRSAAGPLVHLGPPAIALWFLPYGKRARGIVIAAYIVLFFAYTGMDCIPG